MSPTIRHKYKYFHSAVQRAKDRRQKFHFCGLPFDVRPLNVKLNLANAYMVPQATGLSVLLMDLVIIKLSALNPDFHGASLFSSGLLFLPILL